MATLQEAVLRTTPSQHPCNQVSSALLCICDYFCGCWITAPTTDSPCKCEFLCDRWIAVPFADSLQPCLLSRGLQRRPWHLL